MDTLIAGLNQEVEKSGQLDLSMASLMRAGESGEASTRASSTLSDASDGEEPASINGRIQHLMNKIHKEGMKVRFIRNGKLSGEFFLDLYQLSNPTYFIVFHTEINLLHVS